jgi:hypothetical protein
MHTTRRIVFSSVFSIGVSVGATSAFAVLSAHAQQSPPASATLNSASPAGCGDTSETEGRRALLELAFAAASAIPTSPHLKDRSRCQEAVVSTCLQLDEPELASRYAGRIENWRRNSAYADLAAHYARRGKVTEAERMLALASEPDKSAENWREDRVKEKITRSSALIELAKSDAAEGPAGIAKAAPTREEVERRLAECDPIVAQGNFDNVRGVLDACVGLYGEIFSDRELREMVDKKVVSSWGKMPIVVRINVLIALAETAMAKEDRVEAIALAGRAETMMNEARWLHEERIPAAAELVTLRHRAGDAESARGAAAAALAYFHEHRPSIVDIERADALRPLAEAFAAIGDKTAAQEVYSLAIAEGMENPNSRPRAEDLCLSCASMARAGIEPDDSLTARVREILGSLGSPW